MTPRACIARGGALESSALSISLSAAARRRAQVERLLSAARGDAGGSTCAGTSLCATSMPPSISTQRRRRADLGRSAAAWPRIEAYALPRLAIGGCALRRGSRRWSGATMGPTRCCDLSVDLHAGGAPDRLRALRRGRPDPSRHRQATSAGPDSVLRCSIPRFAAPLHLCRPMARHRHDERPEASASPRKRRRRSSCAKACATS